MGVPWRGCEVRGGHFKAWQWLQSPGQVRGQGTQHTGGQVKRLGPVSTAGLLRGQGGDGVCVSLIAG